MNVRLDTLSLPMCTDQTEHYTAAAAGQNSLQERPEPLGELEELLLVPDVVQQPLDDEVTPGVDAELLLPGVHQPGVRDSKGIFELPQIQEKSAVLRVVWISPYYPCLVYTALVSSGSPSL